MQLLIYLKSFFFSLNSFCGLQIKEEFFLCFAFVFLFLSLSPVYALPLYTFVYILRFGVLYMVALLAVRVPM